VYVTSDGSGFVIIGDWIVDDGTIGGGIIGD
jgi:hypothetical protein